MKLDSKYTIAANLENDSYRTTIIASTKNSVIVRLKDNGIAEVLVEDKKLLKSLDKVGAVLLFDAKGEATNLKDFEVKKIERVKTGQGSTKLPVHF